MANSLQLRLAVARLRRLCALRPSLAFGGRGAGGGQRKAGSIKEFNVKEPLPAAFLQVRKKCD